MFGELQLMQISLTFQTSLCYLKIRGLRAKFSVTFFLFLLWKGIMASTIPRYFFFFWTKIWTLTKTRRYQKWKISCTVSQRWTMRSLSYKNCKLKVKLWWVGTCERWKSTHFVIFILFIGIFFKICVLSQCIIYWIKFQNKYTFTYQKTFLHTILLLVFKSVESLQCIPKAKSVLITFFLLQKELKDETTLKFLTSSIFSFTGCYYSLSSIAR